MTTARTRLDDLQRLDQLRTLRQRIDDEITVLAARLDVPPPTVKRRRSRFEVPDCGTETAYQRHRYYGEDCEECKAAHAAHERARKPLREAQRRLRAAARAQARAEQMGAAS